MAGLLVKAIAIQNLDLAKEALATIDRNYINFVYKGSKSDPSYTLLDIAMSESRTANISGVEVMQLIILEMRKNGARTYKELTMPLKGLPPFHTVKKNNRNISSVNVSKKQKTNNNRTRKTNNGKYTNLWGIV